MAGVTRPHKVENFKGQYMIFTYENRHQASFKGCFSAFSNFAHTPLYRLFVLGGRETIAHAKTCLGLLVCVADSHLQLLSAIRYTDSYRMRRKTPPFRAGDIRRVRRICVSN